jgi:hypothetical protein
MTHLLQTFDNAEVWEEVDEYTFKHRQNVVKGSAKDGYSPRYGQGYVVVHDDGTTTISGNRSPKVLGIICRFLNVSIPSQDRMPGGWIRDKVEMVLVKGLKGCIILHQMHGDNYRKVA